MQFVCCISQAQLLAEHQRKYERKKEDKAEKEKMDKM